MIIKSPSSIIFLIVNILHIVLSANETHYTAAVIEYYPNSNFSLTNEERAVQIIDDYINLLKDDYEDLDIAVFPEAVILSHVGTRNDLIDLSPFVNINSNPCLDTTEQFPQYFLKLSCAARNFSTYLLVNIVEKSLCSGENCASDNHNLYNTNVAFDRNGKIIARYRKFHLFGEFQKNVTETVDITEFETDFGVKFGTFICFDVLFEEPPLWLTRNGTKHLTFPTMWFSEAPFLTALQVQNMFSVATNSILLSSGANRPSIGSGGSGIFLGTRGPLNIGIVAETGSKKFTAKVPKNIDDIQQSQISIRNSETDIDNRGRKLDDFYLKRDHLDVYTSYLIESNLTNEKICHEEFCCNFTISITENVGDNEMGNKRYRYRALIYSGVRSYDEVYYGGVEVCAVVFCQDDTIESCGKRIMPYDVIDWGVTFESIAIEGVFEESNRKQQYPNSLRSDLEPLPVTDYRWEVDTSDGRRRMTLDTPQKRLLTFGIYGRDFTRDSAPSDLFSTASMIKYDKK